MKKYEPEAIAKSRKENKKLSAEELIHDRINYLDDTQERRGLIFLYKENKKNPV